MLTPPPARIDDSMEALDFTTGWGTDTLGSARGWGNPGEDDEDISDFDPSQDGSSTQLHSAPALRIVEATMLLSKEALWEHYERNGPEETPMCHWHEEIELGWGGLNLEGGRKSHEALGLRTRYAAQYMLPTTGPEVVASLCKGLHPSNQPAHLEKTDKEWGGNGSGAHLTALNYFICNAPHNLLLVNHSLPLTAEKVMEALRSIDNYNLRLMTEEYDLQMGGTGSGTYFFHAIPHSVLDANLEIQARIMTMQTPPTIRQPLGKAVAAVAEHARQLTANRTWVGPPLSYESATCFLHNYCVDADLPTNCITADIMYDITATHTPDVPRSAGLPSYHSLQKHIRKICIAVVLELPQTPTNG